MVTGPESVVYILSTRSSFFSGSYLWGRVHLRLSPVAMVVCLSPKPEKNLNYRQAAIGANTEVVKG